jgi:DNA-binding phage protein
MARVKPKSADREPALIADLRAAILEADVNGYALAKKAGIDHASVSRFLRRERSLSLDSAARLVEALGLKVVRPSRPRKFAGRPSTEIAGTGDTLPIGGDGEDR